MSEKDHAPFYVESTPSFSSSPLPNLTHRRWLQTIALNMLKSKLLVIAQQQKLDEVREIRGDAAKADFGQQIRNYVLHPYKLVKDVRTSEETSNVTAVMDGDLQPFIQAYLRLRGRQQFAEE